MSDNIHPSLMIVLCQGLHGNRVAVDLESFLQFNAQQDRDLANLEDRWSDYATPLSRGNTARRGRRRSD
jgi:hypothetical protein